MTRNMAMPGLFLAIGLAALAACATPVAPEAAEPELVAGQTASDGSIVSCRNVELTGTRFPQKTCKSELAWAEFDALTAENAKHETDKFQRLNTGCSTRGDC